MNIEARYVYAVVSKLPENQRDEIEKEILGLIEDMKEKYKEISDSEERTKKVLDELGDPAVLADRYRGQKRYLIGPKLFNKYFFVLKIVLISIFIAISVASIVQGIFATNDGVIDIIVNYFTSVISGLFQGFTWVTIIFAILEYRGVTLDDEKWSIQKLPKVPAKKAMIKKGESIAGIIFISIFTLILYFFPNVFGVYIFENGNQTVIPIFDLAYWDNVKYILIGIFLIGIFKEIIKLIYGRWNIRLAIYYIVLTSVSLVLLIVFFNNQQIWNANFESDVRSIYDISENFHFDMKQISSVFVKIIIAIHLIDIISAIYRGIKYKD